MKNFVYSAWGEIRESFCSFGTASHCSCLQRTCIFVVVKTVRLRDCWKWMEKGVINFKPSSSEITASWLGLIQIPLASLKKSIVYWKNQSLLSNKEPFTFKNQSRILCVVKCSLLKNVHEGWWFVEPAKAILQPYRRLQIRLALVRCIMKIFCAFVNLGFLSFFLLPRFFYYGFHCRIIRNSMKGPDSAGYQNGCL